MTKQELLTKLAIECATWEEAVELGTKIEFECLMGGKAFNVGSLLEHEWLAERERLLNKPSWYEAPDGATHLAMDGLIPGLTDSPRWYFYAGEPTRGERVWIPISGSRVLPTDYTESIAIPAGYDWKESLEERPV